MRGALLGLVGGGLAVGLLLAAAPRSRGEAMLERVVARTARHEGGLDALNLNRDGAGLSVGLLQWAQRPGSLGALLRAWYRTDAHAFDQVFGGGAVSAALLDATESPGVRSIDGHPLWHEPWVSRFRAALRYEPFRQAQLQLAAKGEYMAAALEAARVLQVPTERAVSLFFDTAVQQGARKAVSLAHDVKARLAGGAGARVGYSKILHTYAAAAAAPFRRTSAPAAPHPSPHIEWQPTDAEWHAWAGRFDLYADIRRRRHAILDDPDLGDASVDLPSSPTWS